MIAITDLHKRFGAVEVLRGITFSVTRGEVCVLLGPSGGGKSTLLRTINGLDGFDRGTIRVGDVVLYPALDTARERALREIRRHVGMVFQQFNLFPHRSVLENVIEAPIYVLGRPREAACASARALLDRVGLADKIDARPGQLSGGQQQRVAIARALAMAPEVILFDEPTSALDPRMAAEVMSVMSDLAADGQTMIVVTHALDFARHVAHQVHVMHAGRIAESGTPEQIFEAPQQEVTRQFLTQAKVN
jgi:ABC-type polar amino acid transport system ATPase subunit